ncbi:MAG: cell division cycle 123 family protein [Lentisphaerales bacterium]|nr:cell division cycle 123 family protein [Lentisphaerales bacterium]
MSALSDWYSSLADFTFPTMFVRLREDEKTFLVSGEDKNGVADSLKKRIDRTIAALPGSCFVGADTVSPDDAPSFTRKKSHSNGKTAISTLLASSKVKTALIEGSSDRLSIRPYRRMDKTREFRLFIFNKELSCMSQRNLERHFRRLEGRRDELWQRAVDFSKEIIPFLDQENAVVDIYFTSDGNTLIVDMNEWGKCDPLLFRDWDRDWSEKTGLKLMAEPIKMKGDVKVSF